MKTINTQSSNEKTPFVRPLAAVIVVLGLLVLIASTAQYLIAILVPLALLLGFAVVVAKKVQIDNTGQRASLPQEVMKITAETTSEGTKFAKSFVKNTVAAIKRNH